MYARMVAATGDTNLDYDSFVAALTAFGSGQMNSLSAAMRRAGLPNVPGNLNSVMAYAARQIATGMAYAARQIVAGNTLRAADAGQNAAGESKYDIKRIQTKTGKEIAYVKATRQVIHGTDRN